MVGGRAAEVVDELVVVGKRAEIIARTAHKIGLSGEKITKLENSQQVVDFLNDRLDANDVVLVKGSHAMRLDQVVTALEESE